MLYYRAVDNKILELLKKIREINIFNKLLLAGGTSLALQIGHRISVDIDLFGEINVERIGIINELKKLGEVKTIHHTSNINIFTVNDIKVDIVNYPYPWIRETIIEDNIRLANIADIAAMKISAITGRGTMKDFIDLHFLLKQFSLKQILEFYKEKYSEASVFMALKSLSYFDDADSDISPKMFEQINWNDIKLEISNEVRKYLDNE